MVSDLGRDLDGGICGGIDGGIDGGIGGGARGVGSRRITARNAAVATSTRANTITTGWAGTHLPNSAARPNSATAPCKAGNPCGAFHSRGPNMRSVPSRPPPGNNWRLRIAKVGLHFLSFPGQIGVPCDVENYRN